jgi:hypothetical protein
VLYLHRNPDGSYDLDRHGPITAQTARRILATSSVLIKPVIDLPTLTSTAHSPRYVPPVALREAVQIRDRTCRFPAAPAKPPPARSTTTNPGHTVKPHSPTCAAYAPGTTD